MRITLMIYHSIICMFSFVCGIKLVAANQTAAGVGSFITTIAVVATLHFLYKHK